MLVAGLVVAPGAGAGEFRGQPPSKAATNAATTVRRTTLNASMFTVITVITVTRDRDVPEGPKVTREQERDLRL
jgi:hypothetical protein